MHYRLFHIGQINIYSYGFMVALAFIVGIYIAANRAKKLGENYQNIYDLCLYLMFASIIGARLTYVLTNWEYYRNNPVEIVMVNKGGLVFYGGLILAGIVSILFLKIKKLNVWKYFDILSPSIAIGHALGRVGCFLNGCCYGKLAKNSVVGVKFPKVVDSLNNATSFGNIIGSPPFLDHLHNGLITENSVCSLPVYPTQIFSSLMNFSIFLFLIFLFKKRRFNGQIWCAHTMLYAVGRFSIEFLRGDNPLIPPLNLTLSQHIAIFLFLLGLFMYIYLCTKQKKQPI